MLEISVIDSFYSAAKSLHVIVGKHSAQVTVTCPASPWSLWQGQK